MPSSHLLAVGQTPTLRIHEVEGDLVLTGWERPELLARGPKGDEIRHLAEANLVELRAERNRRLCRRRWRSTAQLRAMPP